MPHLIRLNVSCSELEMQGYFGKMQNSELVSEYTLKSLISAQILQILSLHRSWEKSLKMTGGLSGEGCLLYKEVQEVQRRGGSDEQARCLSCLRGALGIRSIHHIRFPCDTELHVFCLLCGHRDNSVWCSE